MKNYAQKPWLSPFVAVTYVAVAITGILMLLHVKAPGVHSLHQWGGVLFAVAGTIHLLLNWRMLVSYFTFTKQKAIWGTAFGVLALILITLVVPADENGRGERYRGGARSSLQYGANN